MRNGGRKLAVFVHGKGLGLVRQHLNANVISARGMMFLNSIEGGFQVAPDDNRVDQLVASSAADIAFLKSQAQRVVGVIGQA